MKLRNLDLKDAPLMLEWMHDDDVTGFLGTDFSKKTINDCESFIKDSLNNQNDNLNLAIADDNDEYMGTVSLKHIDRIEKNAEFAISTRKASMGKGYAAKAMSLILKLGNESLGLDKIYWCVSVDNKRAVRFYDKNGYMRTDDVPDKIKSAYTKEQLKKFIWYLYS